MKEKPVFPLLVSMALPMVISMLVNSLYNIVDSFFVAQISEDAMTALSLVYPVQNFVNAVAIGFGIGLNAVISYYLGAGDKKAAGCAATQGLALTMLHAVILTIGSLLVIERFLRMFSSSETVIDLGVRYSRIIFLFTIAIMANLYFEKGLSGGRPDESDDDRYDDRLYCQHHSGSADYFRNRTVSASWN